jgi:hypothetical protein
VREAKAATYKRQLCVVVLEIPLMNWILLASRRSLRKAAASELHAAIDEIVWCTAANHGDEATQLRVIVV